MPRPYKSLRPDQVHTYKWCAHCGVWKGLEHWTKDGVCRKTLPPPALPILLRLPRVRLTAEERRARHRECARKWRHAHREHMLEYYRSYYREHREKRCAYMREYHRRRRAANRESKA